MQKTAAETLLAKTGADKNRIANEEALNKQGFEKLESIKGIADPGQRQAQYSSALQWAQQNNVDISKFPQQVPNNEMLSGLEAGFGMHAQAVADAKDLAQTQEASSRVHEADVKAKLRGSVSQPSSRLMQSRRLESLRLKALPRCQRSWQWTWPGLAMTAASSAFGRVVTTGFLASTAASTWCSLQNASALSLTQRNLMPQWLMVTVMARA
jgi:hypothetical protein